MPPVDDLTAEERERLDTTGMGKRDKLQMREKWYGIKRYGYRVSRLLTVVNLGLLLGITGAAVYIASQTTLGTGAHSMSRSFQVISIPLQYPL